MSTSTVVTKEEPSSRLGRSAGPKDRRPLILFFVALVLSAPVHVRYLVPLDEGAVVHVAERLAQGEVLYRDVATGVMPGVYYLLALLFKVFGSSITVGRVLQMLVLAGSTTLIYVISRRFGRVGASTLAALVYFAVALFGYRYPSYSSLAVLMILIGVYFFIRALDEIDRRRWFALGGVCLGLALLTKQNYGATVFAALFGTVVLRAFVQRFPALREAGSITDGSSTDGAAEWSAWIGVVIFGTACVAPIVLAVGAFAFAGAGDEMLGYTVESVFSTTAASFYMPFPLLALNDPFHFLDDRLNYFPSPLVAEVLGQGLHRESAGVLIAVTYLTLPAILLAGAFRILNRLRRSAIDWAELGLVLSAVALFTGVFPRSDFQHLMLVSSLPLIVGVMLTGSPDGAAHKAGRRGSAVTFWLTRLAMAGFALFALAAALPPLLGLVVDFPEKQNTRVGRGRSGQLRVSAPQAEEIRGILDYLEGETPEGAPILVIPEAPLYYFLADRPNPTPYPLVLPGSFDEEAFVASLNKVDVILYQDLTFDGTPVATLFPTLDRHLTAHFSPDLGFLDRLRDPGIRPVFPLRRSETPRSTEGLLLVDLPGETRIVDVEGGVSEVSETDGPRVHSAPWLTTPTLRLQPVSGWQKLVHSVWVDIPAGGRLEFSPALLPAPRGETADGAVLEVFVHDLTVGQTQRVFTRVLDPEEPDSWRPRKEKEVVDLGFLAGSEAILTFLTYGGARLQEDFDVILLTDPRLVAGVLGATQLEARNEPPSVPLGLYDAIRRFDDLRVFEQASRARPEDPLARAHLGLVHARAGRIEPAIAALRQAKRLDPSLADVQLALAEVLANQGRTVEACVEYGDLQSLDPGSVRALTKLGDCALDVDQDLERARH